jgi:glycosyltransferase involved in cell wall biosynthesis
MHAEHPYISVVIPTYNRAAFVVAAVSSALAQRDAPWSYEIVVVDDGSDDQTEQALEPFAEAIRYHRIEHSGVPAVTRNAAIELARGELIAFLDSDDLWTADKLATQVPVFDDPAVVLSYAQARKIYGDDPTPREPVVDETKLRRGEACSSKRTSSRP